MVKHIPLPGTPIPLKPIVSKAAKLSAHIRPASPTDLPAIQSCARAAYTQYLDRMDRDPAPMVADFASLIQRQRVHVALLDSAVVGYVVFYKKGKSMQLDNVAVNPEVIGQGIGKQLIGFVESATSKQGLLAVELYTNVAMTENQVLYPKLGYVEVSRGHQDGFSRVFYRKRLGS